MSLVTKDIVVKAEVLTLTNQRVIYWKRQESLILSDVHIGKTAHFRKHGIPIPDDVLVRDLSRLEALIHHFKPKRIICAGDLFHAGNNRDIDVFREWINQFQNIEFILIKGNHDRLSNGIMQKFKIETVYTLELLPFIFIHEHSDKFQDEFTISGHTHPGVLIRGKGKQKIKLPCYQLCSNKLILPAFSLFTGLNTHSLPDNAINFAFTESDFFQF